MADDQTYYEMLWDCTVCNTKGLLGSTHRHCPMCGAAQDPTKRYFPKPGQEIEAKGHQFVGTDWRCTYCSSPNSAAAAHCINCGAGQDGSKPVAIVSDVAPSEPSPTLPMRRPSRIWPWLLGGITLALIGFATLFFSTKETTVKVVQRGWEREIQIERLMDVTDSAWCDSLPSGAYAVTHSREQRSTRKVEAGQDCHEQRVDKGDGTFAKKQECVPRYREEPVYDDRCHFRINRWQTARRVSAGAQLSATPIWPSIGTLQAGLNSLGAEREGARRERYTLNLADGDKTWSCDVSEAVWARLTEGAVVPMKVRLTGGAACDSLR
ncbi:MAG: hypothetical protein KJ787_09480 [Gammaproteobacteria bacterium]|nr:hypothetical protein [Gammaproteobacteria bacterium]MBU1646553.1 hypothetical protein [Gammaproteobacteria bacterium]MBU1972810.1 hypothetical protein [Gammaproteobacteria bacterium]